MSPSRMIPYLIAVAALSWTTFVIPGARADEPTAAWRKIAPFFQPPPEFADKLGS